MGRNLHGANRRHALSPGVFQIMRQRCTSADGPSYRHRSLLEQATDDEPLMTMMEVTYSRRRRTGRESRCLMCSCLLLVSPLSPVTSLQPEKRGLTRRMFAKASANALLPASAVAAMLTTSSPQRANAIYNPLNLKGSFWETGELYLKKESELPQDPDDLLPLLRDA